MIIWKDNIVNANLDLDKFISEISVDIYYDEKNNHHTTYGKSGAPDMQLAEFYANVIERFMIELGIYHRCKYSFNMWSQVYSGNNISNHSIHDHYASDVFLSWCHFLQLPEQDCFCFIDSNKNKLFPEQRSNDLIVFPSWALHKVIPFISDKCRVIVAGNITLSELYRNGKNINVLG